MYCRQCGQPIGSQPFCQNCGAPAAGGNAPGVPPGTPVEVSPLTASKVAAHLRPLGILWVAFALYAVLRWLLVLPVLHVVLGGGSAWMAGSDTWMYAPFHPGGWLLHVIALMVFLRALLSLAVGFALLTRQPWGRTFAIVIAVLTLIKPLLGTLLAIYTLWVLLGGNAGPEYRRIALRSTPPL